MSDSLLPNDVFSRTLRAWLDNPGAVGVESTVHTQDFYGNTESWIVRTFRAEGREVGFLQRNAADGALRLVLPPEVMASLSAQRERVVTRTRKRAARRALETRRERGDTIGNPEALAKARRAKKRGKP